MLINLEMPNDITDGNGLNRTKQSKTKPNKTLPHIFHLKYEMCVRAYALCTVHRVHIWHNHTKGEQRTKNELLQIIYYICFICN